MHQLEPHEISEGVGRKGRGNSIPLMAVFILLSSVEYKAFAVICNIVLQSVISEW